MFREILEALAETELVPVTRRLIDPGNAAIATDARALANKERDACRSAVSSAPFIRRIGAS